MDHDSLFILIFFLFVAEGMFTAGTVLLGILKDSNQVITGTAATNDAFCDALQHDLVPFQGLAEEFGY